MRPEISYLKDVRRISIFACAAVLHFAVPAEISAKEISKEELATMRGDELRALMTEYLQKPYESACDSGVPVANEMYLRRGQDSVMEGFLEFAKGFCSFEKNEPSVALQHFDRATELKFGTPEPYVLIILAGQAEDSKVFMEQVRLLIFSDPYSTGYPDEFYRVVLWFANEHGLQEQMQALALEAYEAGRLDALNQTLATQLASSALSPTIERDPDAVAPLLQYLSDPQSYPAMLASRKYESIWPILEERVGPGFAKITAENLGISEAKFAADRKAENLERYVSALRMDNRHEEAVAALRDWRAGLAEKDAMEQSLAWAMNSAAYSLDALGREDEASALFDELAALDPDSHPWLVSFVINRASRIVGQGKWEVGLAATQLAREVAEVQGNDYARNLIARDRACALNQLGRTEEAQQELDRLREMAQAGYTVAAEGLMCMGLREEAAQLLTGAAMEADQQATIAEQLQPSNMAFFNTRSMLPAVHELLSESEELRTAFLKIAREIPEEFYPASTAFKEP